jgi:hypothetical protein
MVERLGHARHYLHRLSHAQAALLQAGGQVAALDELGDDVTQAVVAAAEVEDGDDAGVVQRGQDACLGEVGVGVAGGAQAVAVRDLDGNVAAQVLVVTSVDDAKAALAQLRRNPIPTQTSRPFAGPAPSDVRPGGAAIRGRVFAPGP